LVKFEVGLSAKIPADLILVGHITGAYGVQGWVRIHPYSAEASALLHAKTWWLSKTADGVEVHDVEKLEAKIHGEDVVARIMGIAGRDAAEGLKGHVVQIQRSHFPVLSNNEFYWLDLIGLAVENLQGESLGVVTDLIDNGAHPILRVVLAGSDQQAQELVPEREFLIPFIEQFVPVVDQKNKKITVDWGLDY
jgi:16S rRNA processing protein RimM